jgi:PII-like signaling protein
VTNNIDSDPKLSVLRVYLRRRKSKPGGGFWGRLLGRQLSYDLAERALKAGVTYATVTLGHAGFVSGATHIAADLTEVPLTTLPACVDLVGPVAVLEAFVETNRKELADAILLRLDDVAVSLRIGTA